MFTMINIGYGNNIERSRVLAVLLPDSAPIRRLISSMKEENRCLDCTCGNRTRSVILLDDDWIVLCALEPDTVTNRLVNAS